MQSLSLTLSKRLSNSQPLFRISSNLVAYASTTSSSPSPSPPISASSASGTAGSTWSSSTLSNLLSAPWSASQTRGVTVSGSDVRVGNLVENRGRSYEVLKLYRSLEGTGKGTFKVPPQAVAGYATVASAGDDIKRKERSSGLTETPKTKREQLLKGSKRFWQIMFTRK